MRTFGFRAVPCRRLVRAVLLAAVLAGLVLAAPAEARDRPGTPNQEALYICDYPEPTFAPVLCGKFNNTATEVVRIEIQATRNGQPYAWDANTFNCKNLETQRVYTTDAGGNKVPTGSFVPRGEICYTPSKTYGRMRNDPDYPYVFETPPVAWNTQFCIQFRARRVSDSVVSEKWSNFACANVPPQPALPTRPDFSFSFAGSQMYGQPTDVSAKPGQTAQVIPAQLIVKQTAISDRAVVYRLLFNGAPMQEWKVGAESAIRPLSLPGNQQTVSVELCGYNFSGHTCMARTVNVLAQGSQPLPRLNPNTVVVTPKPIHITGAATATRGPTVTANSETYMVGVDMPGNDYSNQPISGTAVDCQHLCNIDGKCLSWTWVKPGVQNAQAMCWLKNAVPPSRSNPNTTSGIKAGSTAVH